MKLLMKCLVCLLFITQLGYSQNIKLDLSGKTGYFESIWSTHNFSSKVNMVVFFDEGVIYLFETYISTIIKYYLIDSDNVTKKGKSKDKIYHIILSDCANCDNKVHSFDINFNNMQVNFNYRNYSEIYYISDYEMMTNNDINNYLDSKYKETE